MEFTGCTLMTAVADTPGSTDVGVKPDGVRTKSVTVPAKAGVKGRIPNDVTRTNARIASLKFTMS